MKILIKILILGLILFSNFIYAGTVKLAWDASPSLGVAGYDLYYGTVPNTLVSLVDVGNTLSYTVNNVPSGTRYYYALKSYDTGKVNVSAFSNIVSTVAFDNIDTTLSTSPTNTQNDNSPVELGTKFTPIISGKVYGIKVFIAQGFVGDRKVTLWNSSGVALATATLPEDGYSSGFQIIDFPPVDVVGGQTYTVSFFNPTGLYPYQLNFFNSQVQTAHIIYPNSAGVYAYSPTSAFPNLSYENEHYFIEPIFSRSSTINSTFNEQTPPSFKLSFESIQKNDNTTIYKDTSINTRHCLSSGDNTPTIVDGKLGNGVRFDNRDFITCPSTSFINLSTNFTVMAWGKSNVPLTGRKILLTRPASTPSPSGVYTNVYSLEMHNGYAAPGIRSQFGFEKDQATYGYSTAQDTLIAAAGEWHHYAATYTSTSVKFYVDGISTHTILNPGVGVKPALGSLLIGGNTYNNLSGCSNCDIDEVVFYPTALSPAQVAYKAAQLDN